MSSISSSSTSSSSSNSSFDNLLSVVAPLNPRKRSCPSIVPKGKTPYQNPKEFTFNRDGLNFQVIFIYKNDLMPSTNSQERTLNKYAVLEEPTHVIRTYYKSQLADLVIPKERKKEFGELLSTKGRRPGLFRLWTYAGLVSREQVLQNSSERDDLYSKMTNTSPNESLKSIKKDIGAIAYPRLIMHAYNKNIFSTDDALFYLQTAYKREISPKSMAKISEINQKILLNKELILEGSNLTINTPPSSPAPELSPKPPLSQSSEPFTPPNPPPTPPPLPSF